MSGCSSDSSGTEAILLESNAENARTQPSKVHFRPRRSSLPLKLARDAMSNRRRVADSSESEAAAQPAPLKIPKGLDAIYLNQPLDHPALTTKLKALMTEIDAQRPQLEAALEFISTTASEFAEAAPAPEGDVDLDNLPPDTVRSTRLSHQTTRY